MGQKVAGVTPEGSKEQQLGRFDFSNTPAIRALLSEAVQHPQASQELRALCQQHLDADAVPWKLVQRVCTQLRQHTSDQHSSSSVVQQPAHVTCQGARLVLPSPPVRQRSKQLQEHLAKLQDKVDQQRYTAMVADVAQQEQKAAAAAQDPFFPTTKLQMSFGLHVLATMGAFSVLGYYTGRLLLNNNAWAAVFSALGLAAGLLLETTLLIIRTNMPVPLDQKYAHLLDKRWDKQQLHSRQGAAGRGSSSSSSRASGTGRKQPITQVGANAGRQAIGHAKHE